MRLLVVPLALMLLILPVIATAQASPKNAMQVQGAWVRTSRTEVPNPARCGPSAVEAVVVAGGVDALGGSYFQTYSFCVLRQPSTGNQAFDWKGFRTYVSTGELATIELEDYRVDADFDNCFAQPTRPVKLTIDGFTGEHAGGRFKGHMDFAAEVCVGALVTAPIVWYDGVFTPNAP